LLGPGTAQERSVPPAFVEVEGAATTVWVHEPVELTVRVGYDTAFFAERAVPLLQQALDQPFLVTVPWLQSAEDRAVEIVPPAAATGQRVAVGGRVVLWQPAGQRAKDGHTFALLELRCRWVPLAAGVATIAPVELRYAFATRFAEDFLRGRQPLDRQEATASSGVQQLTVKALPAAGRPEGFTGAVGEFEVRGSASPARVMAGAAFTLEVVVAGNGNLERFAPMPWPRLPGFHVQGLVEKRVPAARTFLFDVVALREGVAEVPAVPFVAFSPRAGNYVTLAAGPVPLQVLPAPADLPSRVRELMAADAHEVRGERRAKWWWVVALAGLAFGMALGLWRSRVRHARRRAELRAAHDRLAVALARDPAEALAAIEALCCSCAGVSPFEGDTIWYALARRGTSPQLVARLRAAHAELEAARYGGPAPAPQAVLGAAAALATLFSTRVP